MEIRFAKKEDMAQVISLCQLHAVFEKAQYNPENKLNLLTKYLFQSPNGLKCLVVELDKKIVGYATFIKQFSTWDAAYYVYLDCLYLEERVRGKGLGIQLMEEIETYTKSENCTVIQWQTPNFNEKAILFYKKLGASSKTKERFFWDVGSGS